LISYCRHTDSQHGKSPHSEPSKKAARHLSTKLDPINLFKDTPEWTIE
jgi:hypothetical protein